MYLRYIYKGLNLVITVPADGLAPNGARPTAGTVLITKLVMIFTKFLWISVIPNNLCGPSDVI